MTTVRPATVGDAPALSALWSECGIAHRPAEVADELASVLRRDAGLVLVAEDDRGIVGSVLGTYDGRRGWVNRLATRPDARSQGVAGTLLQTLETALRRAGCRKINLLVEPANASVVTFYQQHGWSTKELIFLEKRLTDGLPTADGLEHRRC